MVDAELTCAAQGDGAASLRGRPRRFGRFDGPETILEASIRIDRNWQKLGEIDFSSLVQQSDVVKSEIL